MILSIFDFDATLFDTPLPTDENRELLSVFKGYNGMGWWGRAESLDTEVFDIKPNPWVKEKYDHHTNLNHTKILITGRIFKIRDSVKNVISDDFIFDEMHFADGTKTVEFKINKIHEVMKKYNPTEIYFYDDRTEHIPTFRMIGDKIEDSGVKFRLFHVIGHNGYELKYGKKLR